MCFLSDAVRTFSFTMRNVVVVVFFFFLRRMDGKREGSIFLGQYQLRLGCITV